MTSENDGASGDGARHAAESLRAAHDALPGLAEHLDAEVRRRIDATSAAVEHAARHLPADVRRSLLGTAHEIRLTGTRMTAAREDAFTEIAHVLTSYADEIDTLLRPTDATSSIPPPAPAPSVQTTAQDTAIIQHHLPDAVARKRAINQVVAQFPPKLQALARTLLFSTSSHAVQRHGHHLRRDHQIARLQWRLDPAGVDSWQLEPDGSVRALRGDGKPHQVRATAGQYASAEAFAKPLIALLQAAGRTQDQLDRYLDDKAEGKTRVTIFLDPATTGIVPGDVLAVRGTGTDTEPGEELWLSARDGAMAGHGSPPWVRDHDLVSGGRHPGSLILFRRRPQQPWRLVTGYFLDDHTNKIDYTEL